MTLPNADLNQTSFLLWRHRTIKNALVLKTSSQKQLIGFIRLDKSGEVYWKFQEWTQQELKLATNYEINKDAKPRN